MKIPHTMLDGALPTAGAAETAGTRELVAALVAISPSITDIFFSPMRLPEVRLGGRLVSGPLDNLRVLTPAETMPIAHDLMAKRPALLSQLAEGGCHLSFFLPHSGRFRVQVLQQRGSFAILLRVIPNAVPTIESQGGKCASGHLGMKFHSRPPGITSNKSFSCAGETPRAGKSCGRASVIATSHRCGGKFVVFNSEPE